MSKHFENVADMKTLIETKKLTNDGLLSLESYEETAAVSFELKGGGEGGGEEGEHKGLC